MTMMMVPKKKNVCYVEVHDDGNDDVDDDAEGDLPVQEQGASDGWKLSWKTCESTAAAICR